MAKNEFYENEGNSNYGLERIKQKIFELRGQRVMLDMVKYLITICDDI